ncbi:MAG: hypothetical protein COA58_08215 [Bacteroidetes bacterium]|nr:MAG: hypothetical protein COA58_08215 [Bacteroidota bacterium]
MIIRKILTISICFLLFESRADINYDSLIRISDSTHVKMKLYSEWVNSIADLDAELQDQIITQFIIAAEREGSEFDIYNAYASKVYRYRLFAEYEKNLVLIERIEEMPYYQKHIEAQFYMQTQNALTLHRMGNYDGAIELYTRVLKKVRNSKKAQKWKTFRLGKVLRMIGEVYESQKRYDKAINYFRKSIILMSQMDFDPGVYNNYKELSSVYAKKGWCDSALIFARLSDSFFYARGNLFFAASSERNKAAAYGCLNDFENQYFNLISALDKVEKTKYRSLEFSVLLDIAIYYYDQKQSSSSFNFLDSAEALLIRAPQSERLRFFNFSYQINKEERRWTKSYEAKAKYQEVKNEIYDTRTLANLAFLSIKSNNLLEDKDLRLMQDANQLEILKVENSKFNQKILIVSLIVLGTLIIALITLFFIIRNNIKNKKEYNELLGFTNAKTSELLQQKEQLLREIHHRVKNNLQIIISVLNLHKSEQTDKARVLESCRSQIQTMALIHEEIYKSEDLKSISFHKYMNEMVRYFLKANSTNKDLKINLKLDEFELDLDTIIPTGLIVNELFSLFINEDGQFQNIVLTARKNEDLYVFTIEDSNPKKLSSKEDLRVRIVEKLVTKQLRGDIHFEYINRMIKTVKFNFRITCK